MNAKKVLSDTNNNKRLIEALKSLVLNHFSYHFFNYNVKKIQTPLRIFIL